ncbi:MAG: hypothetical protein GQ574_10235 [Crocinitomix sp.]|nr:hypothetical protein [Crocinitomix sp.]
MAWKVNITVRVKNDLFVKNPGIDSVIEPLVGVRVILSASTVQSGGWVPWGSGVTDANGTVRIIKSPIDSGRIGYKKPRRFKYIVQFSNSKAKIVDGGLGLRKSTIITGGKNGDEVNLTHTFDEVEDGRWTVNMTTGYKDTRSAQMLVGYTKVNNLLRVWNAGAIRFQLVWPDGKGTATYSGWSPPGGFVRIARSWFCAYSDKKWVNPFKNKSIDPSGDKKYERDWILRELTHEAVHQWFYARIFTPAWKVHNTGNTHDFLEDPALAFFQAVAEFMAIQINDELFDIDPTLFRRVRTRHNIYEKFKDARKASGTAYFMDSRELVPMIEGRGRKYTDIRVWHKQFYRAELVANNYLNLLLLKDWFKHDFGDDFKTGDNYVSIKRSKTAYNETLSRVLFRPKDIAHAIVRWRDQYPKKKIPASERGIEGFYRYLASKQRTYRNNFGRYKQLLLNLGDPHYAGKLNGKDANNL